MKNQSGRVVRNHLNTNPGLNGNRSIPFYWIKKCLLAAHVWRSLRLFKPKTEGQTTYAENLTAKLQIGITILANPGLAWSGFKQPNPEGF